MDRELLRPRWLLAHLTVASMAVAFAFLGVWQLDRHGQRMAENERGAAHLSASPVPLSDLLAEGVDPDDIRYRRVTIHGVFDPFSEVLVRSQVHLGEAGFHLVTPMVGEGGINVLVNRGWVPLALDQVPVTEAAPPAGPVTVEGWVEPSRRRPRFGPEDPPAGRLVVFNRVDIDRIQDQIGYQLAPLYLVTIGGEQGTLPEPVKTPAFDDAGPHLGYAIQWFGFALIGVVGYGLLIRRRLPDQVAVNARPSTTS